MDAHNSSTKQQNQRRKGGRKVHRSHCVGRLSCNCDAAGDDDRQCKHADDEPLRMFVMFCIFVV